MRPTNCTEPEIRGLVPQQRNHSSGAGQLRPPHTAPASASPEFRIATETVYRMERLNRAIKGVHSSMEKIMQQATGAEDLTLMHWCILVRLLEKTTHEQVQLRAQAGITAPHLTKLLDDFVARDLVRRDRCRRDRRKFILTLTQAGRTAGLTLLTSLNGVDKKHNLVGMGEFHQQMKALMSICGEAQLVECGPMRHS